MILLHHILRLQIVLMNCTLRLPSPNTTIHLLPPHKFPPFIFTRVIFSSLFTYNPPSSCHQLSPLLTPLSSFLPWQVRALGYKIVIIIATDVIPTDPTFKSIITRINTLPVTLVIRLCTGTHKPLAHHNQEHTCTHLINNTHTHNQVG